MNKLATSTPEKQNRRPGFFDEAFRDYTVPPAIRTFAEAFCTRFDVNGICDPAYCANVVGSHTGLGDGRGVFHDDRSASEAGIAKVGDTLLFAYAKCIARSSEGTTADDIVTMLRLALGGASIDQLLAPQQPPAPSN